MKNKKKLKTNQFLMQLDFKIFKKIDDNGK